MRTTTAKDTRLIVGHHKLYGNMTVAITVQLRPKMKSSDTPTATPLRKKVCRVLETTDCGVDSVKCDRRGRC